MQRREKRVCLKNQARDSGGAFVFVECNHNEIRLIHKVFHTVDPIPTRKMTPRMIHSKIDMKNAPFLLSGFIIADFRGIFNLLRLIFKYADYKPAPELPSAAFGHSPKRGD